MVTTYLKRAYSSFAARVLDVPPRLLALLLFLLLLFFPITRPRMTIMIILTTANVAAIFAASWDLLVGRTGQISLGHALFYGTGAYATALLVTHYGLPVWVTIPLSMLVGVLVALLIGLPCLRVKGPYLALVTLAFPLILIGIIEHFLGGGRPIYHGVRFFPHAIFGLRMYEQQVADYYLTSLLLLISAVVLYKVANSKTGVVFMSILDDELASKASGTNVTKYKLMAFAISGLFGTLAGSVSAHLVGTTAQIGMFMLDMSFWPIIYTILGGIGTIYGSITGAYILIILDGYILENVVSIPSEWRVIVLVIFVIVLIIKWPRGVARFITDKLEDLEEARDIEERGKWIWKTYKKK